MVTCCFRIMTFISFGISIFDFATDIMSAYDFWQTKEGYKDRAEGIEAELASEQASNFKADSVWFTTISAEYDALSSFDKQNVYCDIYALQKDPKSLLDVSEDIFWAACVFIGLSVVALVIGYWVLCKLVRSGKIENDKGESEAREKLWTFNSKSAIQFAEVGPQLAILAMMIIREGKLDGYECQEKFYDCGMSGNCSIADMMVPVPLNASFVDIASSNWILALSFAVGFVDVLFNFVSGVFLFISKDACRLVLLPCLSLSLALMPLCWVVLIDGLIPNDRTSDTEGIVAIAITVFISLCFCCSAACFMVFAMNDSILDKEVVAMNKQGVHHMKRKRSTLTEF